MFLKLLRRNRFRSHKHCIREFSGLSDLRKYCTDCCKQQNSRKKTL